MTDWKIELLNERHQRKGFDCGRQKLNDYLCNYAGQNTRHDISRTYVLTAKGSTVVAGYYTLSSGSAAFKELPVTLSRGLPKYAVPTAHIGRFAISSQFQRKGLGGMLLVDALKRVCKLADVIGIHAVTVDAKDEAARSFYQAYGFLSLQDSPFHLFLPMATIRQL